MAKYKAYPEYKDSGVEWLGDIPKNWDLKKLKYISSIQTGSKDTVDAIEDGKYPFFVRSQTIERINSIGANCEAVLTAGDGAGVGKIYHHYKGKFDFHQRVYMLSNFTKVNGRFVYYYLLANFYKVALEGNAKSTVDSLRLPQFLNFEFSFPDTKEQSRIVRQLDILCSYTDSLIEKAEKLIELLKEKRQAVISHAVTKGLNPDAPMKNSGVEWSKTIPLHWGKCRLRWLSEIYSGGTPSKEITSYWENGVIPWINSGAVNHQYITEPTTYISKAAYKNSSAKWIPKDSLVIALAGQGKTKGTVALLGIDTTCNQSMAAIKLKNKELSKYLFWWLKGNYENIRNISGGDLREGLNLDLLGSIQCPIPGKEEKSLISLLLDKETTKIDTLIQKQLQQIELLKERRTALISAAVTGKIDLRDWTPPASSTEASLIAEEVTA
ncbi:restriction endonuclease subunit S [Enterobacter bugandensis]|uniref:restriction endonuclease subunit S n=1 Tax=Enterobacter bugandensis TaxID=881260 RepID=UPI002004AD33|nr:restriction endonuclease subunit S [Enterobacter bugandensis]MCK7147691.1 restriction endonuclease subunit S [Enterobacter bugandensis]